MKQISKTTIYSDKNCTTKQLTSPAREYIVKVNESSSTLPIFIDDNTLQTADENGTKQTFKRIDASEF